MRVSLVLCPNWGIETPHLGIALLAAVLRKDKHEVGIFDFNLKTQIRHREENLRKNEEDGNWGNEKFVAQFIKTNTSLLDSFAEEILSQDTKVIGFSIYMTTIYFSLEIAKRIKERDKSKIIVFGGQHCFLKINAESLIKNEAVDVVVIGEGEETLLELIRQIEKFNRITFCPGIIYKEDGKIVDCGMRLPIFNLGSLPFPDFDDFSLPLYDNPYQLAVLSSRGCPYPCVFCSTKLFWIKYRSMSGERIFREIVYQLNKHRDVHFFTFNDHVINADMQSLSCFCDLVLEAKSKYKQDNPSWEKLGWRGAAVIRQEMDEAFLKKMKSAGCVELELGVESGSSKIRKLMRKPPYDMGVIESVICDIHNAGIRARVNFMFGFPGETEEDFEETLNLLKRNKDFFDQVHPSESFCCIDPGTYLFNHPEEFSIVNQHHSLFWHTCDGKNNYPERLKRHQIFCELAISLGIPLSPGGPLVMLHKEDFLQKYYNYSKSPFT